MPRAYEAVYIFDSTLEDAAINEKLERFHSLLKIEGDINVDHWGRRQLAYNIGQKENGYYAIARFEADPIMLPEYERALKLDDGTAIDFALFDATIAALPAKLARQPMPGETRVTDATWMLAELTHARELCEFLTLPAYERLP